MTSGAMQRRTLLDEVRREPAGFSESVAPIWRLHVLLIVACGIGVGAIVALDAPGRPTAAAASALVLEALIFAATIHALRRGTATDRRWPYAVCIALSCLTAIPGYFFGPTSGFAGVIAHVLVLARLFTGGWGVRSSQALAWTIYGSLVAGQAVVVGLVVSGTLPDASLVPVIAEGSSAGRAIGSHVAVQLVWLGAFLLGRLLQRSYGQLATRADDVQRSALQREALLDEARAEYERALVAGAHGVFSGSEIGGYRLGELLGRGGMGEIYVAVSVTTGRRAALKVLRSDHLRSRDLIEAFLREADVLARVDSAHVARVYDAGGLESAVPFIAMEHLDGRDLASTLVAGKPMQSGELIRLLSDVAAGLEAVHAAGIVHGDLSARNVVSSDRTDDARWKLIDFGIAVAADGADAERLPAAGTVAYMAPERLRGAAPSVAADVYGFAAVLYAAATGRPPYDRRLPGAPAQMPAEPSVDPDVAAVLRVGLAADAGARFQSASSLAVAMRAAIDGQLDGNTRARAAALPDWGPRDDDAPNTQEATPPTRDGDSDSFVPPPMPEPTEVQSPPRVSTAPTMLLHRRTQTDALDDQIWRTALRNKTVPVMIGFLVACVGGIPLIAVMARDPTATYAACAGIAGIAIVTAIMLYRARRGTPEQLNWPWVFVAMFCAGPAYFFGLNSGFVALLTVGLFSNGGFTAGQRNQSAFAIPVVVAASQGTLLALVLSGVLPDAGRSVLQQPGAPIWEPVFAHVLVQGIYISAHVAGFLTDRRHGAMLVAAITAARETAEQRAVLAAARAQLHRALGGDEDGVFCGHTVGGYRLTALLGRGGMGEVYEAAHVDGGDRAAVKLIRGDRFGDSKAVQRFVREAEVLSRIHSPHVARVYSAGADDGPIPHIVMELLDGSTLSDLLRARDTLEPDELRALVAHVGAGLQAVHDAGVVHRDLKPQNIMRAQSDASVWKLLDFGIAKLFDQTGGETTNNVIVGTPQYMAPEQALGRPVDARTDVYSFGLVIYRCVVGRPAYAGRDPAAVVQAARIHGPPDPGYYTDLPRDVERVLRIAVAFAPDDRFASADELRAAFHKAMEGRLDSETRRRGDALLERAPWAQGG